MSDPKRMLDSAPSKSDLLRQVLASADADDPSREAVARLSGKLAGVLPAGALSTATATATATTIATGAALPVKWMLGAALVGAFAGAGIYSVAVPRVVVIAAPATSASSSNPLQITPNPSSSVPDVSVSSLPIVPVPTTSIVNDHRPAPSGSSSAAAPEPLSEPALLDRAHDALLHGDPAHALALTNDHARAYPNGAFAQEREVIAIESLIALGRRDEAQKRADAFRAAYPGSSHIARLDAMLKAP